MDRLYDFNECRKSLKQFGGSDQKDSIYYDNKRYMIKYNDSIPAEKRNSLASSSRNNAFSEYIACHIYNSAGIVAQNTLLGLREGRIVVACEDFCVNGYGINEFEKNGSFAGIDFPKTRYPEIDSVIGFTRKDERIDAVAAEKRFWDMFVMDALLGNFDRHTGNWGYLYNDELGITVLAPVYDCGACLYPMVSDEGMKTIMENQDMIDERIYRYPTAAFYDHGIKISYCGFLNETDNYERFPLLCRSVQNIMENLSMDKVNRIVDDTPALSDIRREFYKVMISERYQKIIVPAFHVIEGLAESADKSEITDKLSDEKADVMLSSRRRKGR